MSLIHSVIQYYLRPSIYTTPTETTIGFFDEEEGRKSDIKLSHANLTNKQTTNNNHSGTHLWRGDSSRKKRQRGQRQGKK